LELSKILLLLIVSCDGITGINSFVNTNMFLKLCIHKLLNAVIPVKLD